MNARPAGQHEREGAAPKSAVAKPLKRAGKPATRADSAEANAKARAERAAIERWEAEGGTALPAERS